MDGRIRYHGEQRPTPFAARWSIQRVAAGAEARHASDAWTVIPGAGTVAGALRAIGLWSLEAPAEDFDADDWWFRAEFDAPVDGWPQLEFGGLAGLCEVWLNDRPLLSSSNMHLRHRVRPLSLRPGGNEIRMRFASLRQWLDIRRTRPRWRTPMVAHQQLRWARVSLLGRTPGWSPPVAAVGPWRAMQWHGAGRVEASELRLRARVSGTDGIVDAAIELSAVPPCQHITSVVLEVEGQGSVCQATFARSDPSSTHFVAKLTVPRVALWWPHTHGNPALYDAVISVRFGHDEDALRLSLGAIGFRSIVIDTAAGDFAVRVNGVPVFCRGACWTPLDVVSLGTEPVKCQAALIQVRDAGMNMLRVSGNMVYEDDAFYDGCDRLGILLWQDFMFANMNYPEESIDFMSSVVEEAEQQLARWQARPSIAVLCGNSEVAQQAAMWGATRENWSSPLFENVLRDLAQRYCPDVLWWPSSAYGGAFPHQNNVGTTSYYGVGAYLRPLEDARRSGVRFASECLAFANMPRPDGITRMAPGATPPRVGEPTWQARAPRDLGADWDFEDVRDHYLSRLYRVDPIALRQLDTARYVELSRATSVEVIAATFAEWRRPDSSCRGALIWFLRDLWAGAGWGLVDDQGLPKAAFYGAKRAFAPVAVFISDEGTNGLDIHIVNEPGQALDVDVEVALYGNKGVQLRSASQRHTVAAHSALGLPLALFFDQYIDLSRAYRFGASEYALVVATLRDRHGCQVAQAFHFPDGLPSGADDSIGLGAKALADSDDCVQVDLRTVKLAQSVHFEFPGFASEDDYFHLAPGAERRVALHRITPGAPFVGSVKALNDSGIVWLSLA